MSVPCGSVSCHGGTRVRFPRVTLHYVPARALSVGTWEVQITITAEHKRLIANVISCCRDENATDIMFTKVFVNKK